MLLKNVQAEVSAGGFDVGYNGKVRNDFRADAVKQLVAFLCVAEPNSDLFVLGKVGYGGDVVLGNLVQVQAIDYQSLNVDSAALESADCVDYFGQSERLLVKVQNCAVAHDFVLQLRGVGNVLLFGDFAEHA